jgi:parvulin-like peptidyl-prolyl isomerase
VNARIAAARKNAASSTDFDRAIAETYGSVARFRERAARALLIEKVWSAEVTRRSYPGDAELLKYYRDNKKKFERPEAVQLQTISFMFPENASAAQQEQAHKKAEDILTKAKSAKNADEFGALADKSSEDDWRVMNGDHGWVHRGTLEPELESAFQMKAGEVSGIIRSRAGYHILRVNGRRAAQQLSFAEVKKELRRTLQSQRQEKLRTALEARLRSKARIEF